MNGDRMSRINELVRSVLAEHMSETLELPENALVTVTRVITSKDLSHAKVYVTCFPDPQKEPLLQAVIHKSPAFKHILAQSTSLHKVPSLTFLIDETEEKAGHIEHILDTLP